MQMQLGCPSLPYLPHLYFVDQDGNVPAEGMAFDEDNGVTILAVLEAEAGFAFGEPVSWAVVTAAEVTSLGVSFSDLHNGLFQGETALETFLTANPLCYLRQGEFSNAGAIHSLSLQRTMFLWAHPSHRLCRHSGNPARMLQVFQPATSPISGLRSPAWPAATQHLAS